MAMTAKHDQSISDDRERKQLLCTIYLPFIVSVVYWVANLMVCTASIKNWFVYQSSFDDARDFQSYNPLFNTLIWPRTHPTLSSSTLYTLYLTSSSGRDDDSNHNHP